MTGMFFCILCMFCLSKEHPHMFFPYQNSSVKAVFHQNIPIVIILIFSFKSCVTATQSYQVMYKYISDFKKKNLPQSEVWKMMDAQVMFQMTFCLQVTNKHQHGVAT